MAGRGERIAVVTGASGGIGRALAAALAERGLRPCLAGRDRARLRQVADELAARGARPSTLSADLATDEGIRALVAWVEAMGRLDVLVHAAGALRTGDVTGAAWDDLDALYRVNLRAPYLVTRALLPLLVAARGEIVFVNSSAALAARPENALYAATKLALRSLAGSLRDQVNPLGVRVLSVYPGQTATPMQERARAQEGQPYDPSSLLDPGDVAAAVVHALALPRTAEVTDITLRPMTKPSSTGSSP